VKELTRAKVLEIIPSCQRGGVPTVVYNLIDRLDKGKFEICLVAPDDGPLYRDFSALCPVYSIPVRGCFPASICRLRKLIKKTNIDIVHAHGKGAAFYGRVASIGLKVRRVYTLHGFNYSHFSPPVAKVYVAVERFLSRLTDRVIAVSEGEKDKADRARVLPAGRWTVIHNGMETKGNGIRPAAGHVIGTLSRTCRAKGLEFLIQAVGILRRTYPDVVCYIAGGTPKGEEKRERSLKSMVCELNLEENVVFLGEITDIESFFSKVNVYVSTSLWEGLPTAILEAFTSKVPVVATNVVGNADLVRHQETGVLARGEDSGAVAAGITYAFENPRQMAAFAENAFRLVSEKFSVDKMVKRHEDLYESLVADSRC
jgi:glycosyltransferase involved in cell wall biosynthesis